MAITFLPFRGDVLRHTHPHGTEIAFLKTNDGDLVWGANQASREAAVSSGHLAEGQEEASYLEFCHLQEATRRQRCCFGCTVSGR